MFNWFLRHIFYRKLTKKADKFIEIIIFLRKC